jgi:hypothetical protein
MKLKALLSVTALVELGSGIALLIAPSLSAQLLVSVPLDSAQLAVIGRFAGAALTAIGVICWVESRIERADSRAGLLLGLLTYNVAAPAILVQATVGAGIKGLVLWPAVVLHLILGFWCIACLRASPAR